MTEHELNGGSFRQCPICHDRETVAMASGISRAGRGRFLLANGSIGEYETELAGLLGEPRKTRELPLIDLAKAGLIGLLMVAVTLGTIAALRSQDYISIPEQSLRAATVMGIAWFGVLIPGLTLARLIENRFRTISEKPRWQAQMERWRQACYCSRDDIVFLPDADLVATPEKAFELWSNGQGERRDAYGPAQGAIRAEGATE